MKSIILIVLSTFLFAQNLSAQQTITTTEVPSNIEAFLEFRNQVATNPEGGAAVFAMALMMYTNDKELGLQALTIALDRSQLSQGDVYKDFQPQNSINYHLKNLLQKPYIARSYVLETSPQNGYKLPNNLKFKLTRNPYSEQSNGDIKVFIKCSGASTPRPITLRKNNKGIWKAVNYNSLFVGTQPPVVEVNDGL